MKFNSKFFVFASVILMAVTYYLGYEARIFGSQFFWTGVQYDKKLDLLILFTVIATATLIAHAIKNKSYNFILIPLIILLASAGGIGGFKNNSPRFYNVELFGASGNANDVTDAGMASNTTVTSASAAFTTGDVGKSCIMYGSGVAGANQTGTIIAYISATQVTVSFTASSTVTNKEFFYGTESTTGIQNAILAADAALGGHPYLPNGVYYLGGSLVTSQNGSNPNCQIYIPYHAFTGQFEYQIDIEGESTVNLNSGYFGTPNPLPTTGVVLRSVIGGSGTNPAVIGGGDATHQVATAIYLKNFTVQCYTNQGTVAPALTGINGGNMYTLSGFRVGAALDVPNQSSADPTSTESAGWVVSFKSNSGPNLLEHCSAMGFKYGFVLNEHTVLANTFVFSTVYAYVFPANDFTIAGYALYHACKNGVYFPTSAVMGKASGAAHVFDLKFECEIDSSAFFGGHWYNTYVSNINDPSNFGNGIIKTISVLGQVELPSTLTVIGGANLVSLAYNVAAPTPATPTLTQVLTAGNVAALQMNLSGFNTTAPQFFVGNVGGLTMQSFAADNGFWQNNITYNSGYHYTTTNPGEVLNVGGGAYFFNGFASGTAGAAATPTYLHAFNANGNATFGLFGQSADHSTALLQINSNAQAQLALHYDASNKTQFTTSSTGNMTIAPSGGASTITGSLNISGAQFNAVTLVSATGTYNVLATDYQVVFTGSTATVVYPTATAGRSLWIANQASGSVTIPTTTTANGTTSTTLTTGQWMYVFYDGTIWRGKIMN